MNDESTSRSAESYVRPVGDLNVKTCCVPLPSEAHDAVPTDEFLRHRYERMLLQIRPSLLEGKWDVLLAAFHPGAPPSTYRVSLDDGPVSLVLGRHTSSPLCVRSDPGLSLRHALVLLSRSADSSIAVRLLDLSSSLGVQTSDGSAARSLATNGSISLRMAETGFFVLFRRDLEKLAPWRARTLPGYASLPPTEAERTDVGAEEVEAALQRKCEVKPYKSHVVAMRDERTAGPLRYQLYVEKNDVTQRFDVAVSLLRAGCLIGRDSRCHISSDRFYFGIEVSRLHCLLIEIDGRAMLFDLASSNGTYLDGQEIDQVALAEQQALRVTLADSPLSITFVPVETEEGDKP